ADGSPAARVSPGSESLHQTGAERATVVGDQACIDGALVHPLPIRHERGWYGTISEVVVETGLPALGWTVDLEVAFVALERVGLRAGRVAIDFGSALRVLTAAGEEQV